MEAAAATTEEEEEEEEEEAALVAVLRFKIHQKRTGRRRAARGRKVFHSPLLYITGYPSKKREP